MRAWIEIMNCVTICQKRPVALFMRAWIEIVTSRKWYIYARSPSS